MKIFITFLLIGISQICYSQTETQKPTQEETEKWILKKLNLRVDPINMFESNISDCQYFTTYFNYNKAQVRGWVKEAYINSDWTIQYGKLKVEFVAKSKCRNDFYDLKLKITVPIKNIVGIKGSGYANLVADSKCIKIQVEEHNRSNDSYETYNFNEDSIYLGFGNNQEADISSRLDKAFKDLVTHYPKRGDIY